GMRSPPPETRSRPRQEAQEVAAVATKRLNVRTGLFIVALLALGVVLAGCGSSSSGSGTTTSGKPSHAASAGNPPPEWAANAAGWPAHNYDLSNARATTNTDINATNVSKLKPLWRFKLPYIGQFGAYASNPIVLDG